MLIVGLRWAGSWCFLRRPEQLELELSRSENCSKKRGNSSSLLTTFILAIQLKSSALFKPYNQRWGNHLCKKKKNCRIYGARCSLLPKGPSRCLSLTKRDVMSRTVCGACTRKQSVWACVELPAQLKGEHRFTHLAWTLNFPRKKKAIQRYTTVGSNKLQTRWCLVQQHSLPCAAA